MNKRDCSDPCHQNRYEKKIESNFNEFNTELINRLKIWVQSATSLSDLWCFLRLIH
jgi:hypothetical protein